MADSDVIRPTGYTSDTPDPGYTSDAPIPDPEYTSDPPNPDKEPDQEAGCGAAGEDFDAAAGGDAADDALMEAKVK
jgi:hypothetical protein